MDPSERLKKWFEDRFNEESFRSSMGEISFECSGFNTLIAFIAQGVALTSYSDAAYLRKLLDVCVKLRSMVEDLQKIPGHQTTTQFYYLLAIGSLVEHSLEAVHYLKGDHGDQAL